MADKLQTGSTLIEHLERHATAAPAALAVAWGSDEISYGELWSRVLAAAARLCECGVAPGDRVVLAAPRTVEFVVAYFACHRVGAVAAPIDPKLPPPVLAGIVGSLRPRVLALPAPAADAPSDCLVMTLGDLAAAGKSVERIAPRPTREMAADLLLTSGTTGEPKGVVLTHANVFAAARNINEFIGNVASDREALALPLNHSFGLGRLRCQMLVGGAVILTGGLVPPTQLFRAIARWKATGVSFVPSGWAMLAKLTGDAIGDYAGQLRYVEIGSSAMAIEEKRRLMRLLPRTRICMHYGLTEASRSAFIEFHESQDRLDSIGRPSPNVSVRIVDRAGEDLPLGEEGAIVIGGEHVATRYWNRSGAEPRDGWLRSGDLGYRAADGYLYLRGREDELINVGGRKVHPAEVEEVLRRHPSVAECACVGAPDPLGITGESVKAFVVAAGTPPDAAELVEFLSGKLEPYKMPVAFEWIAALPRNEAGKVSRKKLAAGEGKAT